MPRLKLQTQRNAAIELLARNEATREEIAETVGVNSKTIYRWLGDPAFLAQVDEARTAIRVAIRDEGIANKQNRIDALNERHRLMTEVIGARASAHQWRSRGAQEADPEGFDFAAYTAAGAETGLMIHTVTYAKDGRREEWAVDTGLLKELREHEKQVAQEMGEWTEKREVKDTTPRPASAQDAITYEQFSATFTRLLIGGDGVEDVPTARYLEPVDTTSAVQ